MKKERLLMNRFKFLFAYVLAACVLLMPSASLYAAVISNASLEDAKSDTVLNPENTEPITEDRGRYGILTADAKGAYSWHDLNDRSAGAVIEITADGKVMLPAWKFASLMEDIKYSYNKQTKTMTLKNMVNGRRIIVKAGADACTYYSSSKAAGIVKDMPDKMYISKSQNAVMISYDIVKLIMNSSAGYKYYKAADMQRLGYDTYSYKALLVYNPYSKIENIPKAANVKGLSNTVKVTIPEGYSVPQTFELLVKKGVCSSVEELYEACENYDFSYYSLIAGIDEAAQISGFIDGSKEAGTGASNNYENRCFRLEGYLFPDTYEFFRLSKGQDAIGVFLRNTESKITKDMRLRAEKLGYSVYEILIIASIIEKEINISSEMPMIASIIYNRLGQKMRLQMDAGSYYVERYVKPNISGDIDRFNGFYNMYKCMALPAGPICSPGIKAVNAALYPAETDMMFFCSDLEGKYYYSRTYEEHLEVLKGIQKSE